jgi:hypothetical protein
MPCPYRKIREPELEPKQNHRRAAGPAFVAYHGARVATPVARACRMVPLEMALVAMSRITAPSPLGTAIAIGLVPRLRALAFKRLANEARQVLMGRVAERQAGNAVSVDTAEISPDQSVGDHGRVLRAAHDYCGAAALRHPLHVAADGARMLPIPIARRFCCRSAAPRVRGLVSCLRCWRACWRARRSRRARSGRSGANRFRRTSRSSRSISRLFGRLWILRAMQTRLLR